MSAHVRTFKRTNVIQWPHPAPASPEQIAEARRAGRIRVLPPEAVPPRPGIGGVAAEPGTETVSLDALEASFPDARMPRGL